MSGIVLLTMARSRSSMTAEIFRRHGVFFGHTRKMDSGGIGYNENLALKKLARSGRGELYRELLSGGDPRPVINGFSNAWMNILKKEGYEGGLWGAKVDAFCDELFDGLDHVKIGLWRNFDDTVASCIRALRRLSEAEWRKVVLAHHELLSDLKIPMIDTDAVKAGDHSSLEQAFEVCGLTYDRSIAETIIR